jgi:hypothetical protein
VPIRYKITRLPDGKCKCSRVSGSGKASSDLYFDRSGLETYLTASVSKTHLEQALQTFDHTGLVTVEADLETS